MSEAVIYTLIRMDGDYAVLLSEDGVENPVARFFLPEAAEEGDRLLWENFSYTLIK